MHFYHPALIKKEQQVFTKLPPPMKRQKMAQQKGVQTKRATAVANLLNRILAGQGEREAKISYQE